MKVTVLHDDGKEEECEAICCAVVMLHGEEYEVGMRFENVPISHKLAATHVLMHQCLNQATRVDDD